MSKATEFKMQTLAVAAILQSATLANNIAKGERECISDNSFKVLINSIYLKEQQTPTTLYRSEKNLVVGLKQIPQILGQPNNPVDPEVTRYVLLLLKLERKLAQAPEVHKKLMGSLHNAEKMLAFGHDNYGGVMLEELARIFEALTKQLKLSHSHLWAEKPPPLRATNQ